MEQPAFVPLVLLLLGSSVFLHAATTDRPNILVILADDMGDGDLPALLPESRIPTSHLDKLTTGGIINHSGVGFIAVRREP
jgi:hypothetical protein